MNNFFKLITEQYLRGQALTQGKGGYRDIHRDTDHRRGETRRIHEDKYAPPWAHPCNGRRKLDDFNLRISGIRDIIREGIEIDMRIDIAGGAIPLEKPEPRVFLSMRFL